MQGIRRATLHLALAALILRALTPGAATAASAQPSPLRLTDGWIRLLPGALPAGGYFTLHNSGTAKLTLTGADSPACGMLMLHKSEDKGGMSSMQDVTEVDVPGGGSLSFAPGSYHLMCMDPKPALKQGASVPVTLSFRGAPPLTARFDVRGATGK
jgi:copper(I)-binding protein